MWVLTKISNKITARYFKHKFIKFYMYLLKNKIKGNEIEVIRDEKTDRRSK